MSENDSGPAEDRVHEAVMTATAEALGEHGYADLTTRTVADRVDVSKSTLHYRYDTKEGLLAAFLEYNAEASEARFEQFRDDPPLDRLVGILDDNLRAIEDPTVEGLLPAYIEIHARAAHSEAFREAIWESEQRYRTELIDVLEDGVAEGVFRPVDPEATAMLLLAVPDSAGLTQHTLGDDAVVGRLRTALNDLVFDSLVADDADVERGDLL